MQRDKKNKTKLILKKRLFKMPQLMILYKTKRPSEKRKLSLSINFALVFTY